MGVGGAGLGTAGARPDDRAVRDDVDNISYPQYFLTTGRVSTQIAQN